MKKKILFYSIALIIMLLVLTGCSIQQQYDEKNQKQQMSESDIQKNENVETPNLFNVQEYSEGVAWASGGNCWYILDEEGYVTYQTEDVSGFRFEPEKFDGGYCHVFYKGDQILDKNGNVVVPAENGFDSIEYGGNGVLKVVIKEENYLGSSEKIGFIDLDTGEYTINPTDEYNILGTHKLGEGMFATAIGTALQDNTVIINGKTGDSVKLEGAVNVVYESTNGYITAIGYGCIYIIDNKCNVITLKDEDFEEEVNIDMVPIGNYGDGLIYVDEIFYDNNGKKVLDFRDKNIYNSPVFVNGYALVRFKNDKGTDFCTIMDKKGNFIFEPKQIISSDNVQDTNTFAILDDIDIMPDTGYLVCRENSEWKVIDTAGKTLVTLESGEYPAGYISDNKIFPIRNSNTKISNYYKTIDNQIIKAKKVESKLNNSSSVAKLITKQSMETESSK